MVKWKQLEEDGFENKLPGLWCCIFHRFFVPWFRSYDGEKTMCRKCRIYWYDVSKAERWSDLLHL